MEGKQQVTVLDVMEEVFAELGRVRIPVAEIAGNGEILARCHSNIGACIGAMRADRAAQEAAQETAQEAAQAAEDAEDEEDDWDIGRAESAAEYAEG